MKHSLTPNGKVNQAYRMGGLIIGFLATGQAVAVCRHRKMSQYTDRADLLELPTVTADDMAPHLGNWGSIQHIGRLSLYQVLKQRYPECRICMVGVQPPRRDRHWPIYYPGHALLRKVALFLNNQDLMPLAFAQGSYVGNAVLMRRSREEYVSLFEQAKQYGLQ